MIFLDTSYIVSYYNEDDVNHGRAVEVMEDIKKGTYGDLLINDYVFDECSTILYLRLKDSKRVMSLCSLLRKLVLVYVDETAFEKTWKLFSKLNSIKLSFTDCSIINNMIEKKVKYLATFDEEFKKTGEIKVIN